MSVVLICEFLSFLSSACPKESLKPSVLSKPRGFRWTTHRAVDGLDDLDMVSVTKYAGHKKQKRLGVTASIGFAELCPQARL